MEGFGGFILKDERDAWILNGAPGCVPEADIPVLLGRVREHREVAEVHLASYMATATMASMLLGWHGGPLEAIVERLSSLAQMEDTLTRYME
jgi:hypothetical protein